MARLARIFGSEYHDKQHARCMNYESTRFHKEKFSCLFFSAFTRTRRHTSRASGQTLDWQMALDRAYHIFNRPGAG